MDRDKSNIIQVLNLSPLINTNNLNTLFGFLGEINRLELYNFEQGPEKNLKVCFVEFVRKSSALMALHLTNTVLIDRALAVLPYSRHRIPDKETALSEVLGIQSSSRGEHKDRHSSSRYDRSRDRDRDLGRDRNRDRYYDRRDSPIRSRRSRSRSRDDISPRRRSKSRSRRRSPTKEKSSRSRRSRSRESTRKRSRSRSSDRNRSSRHHKSSRR